MKIFWAGDSTVKDNFYDTYPRCGLGQAMRLYISNETTINNYAENARSTKSFIEEGRFDLIKKNLSKGDYLFIEFGHNDWNEDPKRHTVAFKDYLDNLLYMGKSALEVGANPVFITPLYCRFYDENGNLVNKVHYEYPDAMKEAATILNVPCIDLCELSRLLILKTDKSITKHWYMNLEKNEYDNYPDGSEDNAHLQHKGAVIFASIIYKQLKELGGDYAKLVR